MVEKVQEMFVIYFTILAALMDGISSITQSRRAQKQGAGPKPGA
jgi:hypothetical protein